MPDRRPREVLIKRINWWWYPVTLVPVVALFLASAYGYVPYLVGLVALFLAFFWLSSLGFALYARFRKKKDLRQ